MKITDIHEVRVHFYVGSIVLSEEVDDNYFHQMVINHRMQEDSIYIAISKTFIEITEKSLSVFSKRPYKILFSYKDADNYKHIMSI